MSKRSRDILNAEIPYEGKPISTRALEDAIGEERHRQNRQLVHLGELREKNTDLQTALGREVGRMRELSLELARERDSRGLLPALRRTFSRMPWFRGRMPARRSIEELLRNQYELSALRLKEAAEFADRLLVAKGELYDEIERLNQRIVEAARNEELASKYVLELRDFIAEGEAELVGIERPTAEQRETRAELDAAKRRLAEHSGMLKLYDTAEDRYERLKESTRLLAETIGQLQSDITLYVTAASEKLDLISGQIQAIGAAADASLVMLELESSLDAMTESINQTTRFVAETQAYFRDNVDRMVSQLELYDRETEEVLQKNLAVNQIEAELEIADAVTTALARTAKPDE